MASSSMRMSSGLMPDFSSAQHLQRSTPAMSSSAAMYLRLRLVGKRAKLRDGTLQALAGMLANRLRYTAVQSKLANKHFLRQDFAGRP